MGPFDIADLCGTKFGQVGMYVKPDGRVFLPSALKCSNLCLELVLWRSFLTSATMVSVRSRASCVLLSV